MSCAVQLYFVKTLITIECNKSQSANSMILLVVVANCNPTLLNITLQYDFLTSDEATLR